MLKYASNVAKSVGFISVQVIKGLNPTLTSYVQDSASTIKDAYEGVKGKGSDIKSFFDDYKPLVTEGIGNAFEDIKSGKWYNPERANKNVAAAFGFDDDDDWLNDDDNDDVKPTSSKNADKSNSVAMAAVAGAVVDSSNNSTIRLTKSARRNTQAMMTHNAKMFKSLTASVLTVNNTLMTMYNDISKPLNAHMQNTYKFQLSSMDELKKQTDYLKTIATILQDRYGDTKKNGFGKRNQTNWDKVFGGNKLPDVKSILNILKKEGFENSGIGSIADLLFDKDLLDPKMLKATDMFNSPIAALITMASNGIARRSSFGRGLDKIVGRLPSIFSAGLHKAHNWGKAHDDGFLGELLKTVTGAILPTASKMKLDPSKYNKGRMDWNGMADKALREVIPTQLAQILSAITGEEARMFNYSTGKWEKISTSIKNFKDNQKKVIGNAASGFFSEFREKLTDQYGYIGTSSNVMKSLTNDYNNLMKIIATTPGLNTKNISELRTYLKKLGVLGRSTNNGVEPLIHEENFNLIIKTINNTPGLKMRFQQSMDEAVNARNKFISNINSSGDFGSYQSIVSGSGISSTIRGGKYGSGLFNSLDDKGNSVFFYLQNYYSDLKRIAHNLEMNGGRTVGVKASYRNEFKVPDNSKRKTPNNSANQFGSNRVKYYSVEDASARTIRDKDEAKAKAEEEKFDNSFIGRALKFIKPDDGTGANKIADAFTKSVESFIYGSEDKGDGVRKFGIAGFIKTMSENIQSIATQFKQFITEFMKEKLDKAVAKGKEFYNKWKENHKDFVDRFKRSFVDEGLPGAFKNTFTEVTRDGIHNLKETLSKYNATIKRFGKWGKKDNSGKNYQGGMVEKTGLAAVSEGEMIIPSKYNPYYDGFASDQSQDSKEGAVIDNFLSEVKNRMYGAYRKGTPYVKGPGTKHAQDKKNKKNKPKSFTGKAAKAAFNTAKKAAPHLKKEFINIGSDLKDLGGVAADTLSAVVENALYKTNEFLDAHFGDSEWFKKLRSGANSPVAKEFKKYLPEGLAGGLTGALVGAGLTGSGMGLLGGAALGASINVIRKSSTLSEMLFGKEDKRTGKMTGGFFDRDVSTFLKKKLPKTVKPGIIGSIAGAALLPGVGVYGGFALGAGLQLLSTTEGFKDAMLGPVGVDGIRRGGLKSVFENRVIQPLSKFVNDGIGKLTNYFNKNVLDPLGRLFNPLKDLTVGIFNTVGNTIKKGIMTKIVAPLAHKFDGIISPVVGLVKGVGKFGINAAGFIGQFPGAVVGGVGDAIGRFNVRHGFSTANAKERIRLRNSYLRNKLVDGLGLENTGFGKWAKVKTSRNMYDEFAANDSVTSSDIQEFMNVAKGTGDFDADITGLKQKYANMVYGSSKDGGINNKKAFNSLLNYMNKNETLDNKKMISKLGKLYDNGLIDEKNYKLLIGEADKLGKNIDSLRADKQNVLDNRKAFVDKFSHLGIDESIFDDKNSLENLKRTVNADFNYKKKLEDEAAAKAIKEAKENKAKMDTLREENPLEAQTADNTKETAQNTKEMLDTLRVMAGTSGAAIDVDLATGHASNKPIVNGAPKLPVIGKSHGKEVEADGETHNLGETKTTETENGPITYVWTNDGWKEDVRDSETSETKKKNEEDRALRNGFFAQMTSGSFFEGMKSLFGFDTKDNENKKPSFLQTALSKIVGFGTTALGFLGILPAIATGIAGVTALLSLLDPSKSLGEKIMGAPGAANKLESTLLGYKRQKYNKGEYQEDFTSTRALKILGKRVLTGRTIKFGSSVLKAPTNLMIKGGHSLVNAAANKVTKVAGGAINKSIVKGGAMGKMFEFLQKVISKMAAKFGGTAAKEATETATKGIFAQILEKGGQKLAQAAAKNVLTIAFVLLAAENGWEDAQANIGMLEKPTLGERFLSSIIAAVNELALGIIPVPVVINIVLSIGGAFGIDVSGIRQKQEMAKAEWQQWNKEHPDQAYNTLKEYLKNRYGLFTTQDRIAGAAKAGLKIAGKAVVGGAKLIGKGIGGAVNIAGKLIKANNEFTAANGRMLGKAVVGGAKLIGKGVVGGATLLGKGASFVGNGLVNGATAVGNFVGKTASNIKDGIVNIQDFISKQVNNIFLKPVGDAFSRFGKFVGDPKKFMTNNPINMLKDLWKETDPEYKGEAKVTSTKTPLTVADDLVKGRTSLVDIIINMNKSILRVMTAPMFTAIKGFRWIVKKVEDFDLVGKIKGWISGDSGSSSTQTAESVSSASTTTTDTSTVDTSQTGSGSHVSQYDPRFRNISFGKSTVAANGCGPAVAATVLRSYGKNAGFEDTLNFAEKNGYVAGASGVSGTRASYFQDILGSNGISTSYTSNSNSIRNAVRSGSPTILLGQDRSNRSKSNSPFGPNPHYVVARGTDSKGNVYIDDPELNRTALYRKDVLNNAKLGVMTGGASGTDGDYVGKYVKKYESGSKGSKMISSGKGDAGGVSFGTYQFPSKKDTYNLRTFWNRYYADKFPGVTPGDNQPFKDAWIKAVDMDPAQFFKNEYSIELGHYTNNLNELIKQNPGFNPDKFSRGTQEAFWSSSVHYGGGPMLKNPFSQPGLNMNMDKNAALDLIYKYKIDHVKSNFQSSSDEVKAGIRKRFQDELNYLKTFNEQPLAPTLVPSGVVSDGNSSGGAPGTGGTAQAPAQQQGYQFKGFTLDFLKDALSVALNKAVTGKSNSTDPEAPKQQSIFGKIGGFLKGIFKPRFGFTNTDNNVASNTTSFSNNAGNSTGESGAGDIINNFPYYNQGDPNWGKKGYGPGTIASSGCGPTSMAMVMKSYGTNVTPVDTVQYSLDHGFRTKNQGTSWGYFANIAKSNGLTAEQYDGGQKGIEVTKAKLASNIPVIGSMRPGDFTKGGHFVVFSGIDQDGTIRVNDPSSRERSVKKWDAQRALSQAKQFWAISKDGKGSIKQTVEASKIPDTTLAPSSGIGGINANTAIASGSGVPIYDFTKKYGNKYYGRGTGGAEEISNNIVKLVDQNATLGNPIVDRIIELLTTIAQNTTNNRVLPSVVSILKSCLQVISNMNLGNTDNEAQIADMNNELITMMSKLDSLSKAI